MPYLSSLLRHSRYVVLANAGNQIVSAADVFLIGLFLPVANVAYYSIGYTLAQRMWTFIANVVSVVFPAASSFGGAEEPEKVRELYLRGMKLAAILGWYPTVALCVFSRPFLLYWLGPDYAREGSLVLVLLTLGFLINAFSYVPYQVLQSTQHARTAGRAIAAYAVLNVGLFALLIPRFGILGAASAFLVAQLLFVPTFVGRANRLLGVNWAAVIRVSHFRPLLAAACTAGVCWILRIWVTSFVSLAVVVSFGMAVYALLLPVFVLDGRERTACLFLLSRWTLFKNLSGPFAERSNVEV